MIEQIFAQLENVLRARAAVYYGSLPWTPDSSGEYPCAVLALESIDSTQNESLGRILQIHQYSVSVTFYVEAMRAKDLIFLHDIVLNGLSGFQIDGASNLLEFESGSKLDSSHSLIQWVDNYSFVVGYSN